MQPLEPLAWKGHYLNRPFQESQGKKNTFNGYRLSNGLKCICQCRQNPKLNPILPDIRSSILLEAVCNRKRDALAIVTAASQF